MSLGLGFGEQLPYPGGQLERGWLGSCDETIDLAIEPVQGSGQPQSYCAEQQQQKGE